eukprot:CAMPEP_0203761608 /NCGR_PEP_ID=MMETSP0098-20131031/14654_1 /ASSEMBLY_ACC=CAM_ASM_000208 /TAXON_ID=96639 /ORGANISM=" , Strain NY0313808BC1" /LENGTH=1178 /DNA_ID=CAMNT_0050655669 /DNA_START=1870 /DNA_END=5403 /DNA_ORIENTATION=-
MKGLIVYGAVLAVALGQKPDTCVFSKEELQQENGRCLNTMGRWTAVGSVSKCCANHIDNGSRLLLGDSGLRLLQNDQEASGDQCRHISTSRPYCDEATDPGCSLKINQDDKLKLEILMTHASNSETCCDTCFCYGDPECTAFDGSTDEWIVCDGRRHKGQTGECGQGAYYCRKEKDHNNKYCAWKKNWESWEVNGSPCQPDWEAIANNPKLDLPKMIMHKRGAFQLELTLGERGVITDADIDTGLGSFKLNAKKCFEHSPRTSNDPNEAFDELSAEEATMLSHSLPNSVDVAWEVVDETTGIHVQLVCTKSVTNGKPTIPRLNVQRLVETQDYKGGQAEGFCASGKIDKQKTPAAQAANSSQLHRHCLGLNLDPEVVACKYLQIDICSPHTFVAEVQRWCSQADLALTNMANDIEECVAFITGGETSEIKADKWSSLVCDINNLDIVECVNNIKQFGWEAFLIKYSNGLQSSTDTQTNCASSVTEYGKQEEGDCANGVSVDYYNKNKDTWEQVLFIPSTRPPCGGILEIDGGENRYKPLFTNPIRVSQCDLSTKCLAQTDCVATVGFQMKAKFETENCRSTNPDTPDCYKCALEEQATQNICDQTQITDYVHLGQCDSCCDKDKITKIVEEGDEAIPPQCREISTQQPYCDVDSENVDLGKKCSLLHTTEAVLNLNVAMKNEEVTCCQECLCWGDPECKSFSGALDKWILCESRAADTCKSSQSICEKQSDHMGSQCVWNETVATQIGGYRADVGFHGSPCQADWEKSNLASMTMYSTGEFSAELKMGERGVIEELHVTSYKGQGDESTNVLTAKNCFKTDPFDGWSNLQGPVNFQDAFQKKSYVGARSELEHVWEFTDVNTGIFIKAVCIRQHARNPKYKGQNVFGGYRMNIESLIEPNDDRIKTAEGFCKADAIYKGSSSPAPANVFENCMQDLPDVHLACKALWKESCTMNQINEGIKQWCRTANIYPGDVDHVEKCERYIFQNAPKEAYSTLEADLMAKRWLQQYCHATKSLRGAGVSEGDWFDLCVSKVTNGGWRDFSLTYGKGSVSAVSKYSGQPACGSKQTQYSARPYTNNTCLPGISIQYLKEGKWIEELFIPQNFPVCSGNLEVTAKRHKNLFIYPVRFEQCDPDHSCGRNVKCAGVQGYDISYYFSGAPQIAEDPVFCPRNRRRLGLW